MIRPQSLEAVRRDAQKVADTYGIPMHIFREPSEIERYVVFSNAAMTPAACNLVETVQPTTAPAPALQHGRFESAAASRP